MQQMQEPKNKIPTIDKDNYANLCQLQTFFTNLSSHRSTRKRDVPNKASKSIYTEHTINK
jgi:hypothetical protein